MSKNADKLAMLNERMNAAVKDTPPVVAAAAETPSPTAPPARAARAARKPAAARPSADLAAVAPITSTVYLHGPTADALRRLQVALITSTGRTVSVSAVVSVALEQAAALLPGGTAQLGELLNQHDKRRRPS